MATVTASIRTTKKNDPVNVRFRLRDGRNVDLYYKSEITVVPDLWDAKKEQYKAKALIEQSKKTAFSKRISDLKNMILDVYSDMDKQDLTSEKFTYMINRNLYPDRYKDNEVDSFFSSLDLYISKRRRSKSWHNGMKVIKRTLQRYELFIALYEQKPFALTFDNLTPDRLEDIESFIRNEHELYSEYPEIYKAVPESRKPKQRGENRIIEIFKKLRSFIIWANVTGITTNNPFNKYKVGQAIYGTPIYISIEERNKIYKTNLSSRPALEAQRDIFIFQCLVGCRVSDLSKLRPQNIINGQLEYIQNKTMDERPETIRVPLNKIAKDILKRYKGLESGQLLPFISDQKYNDAIKEIFKIAGITRMVTVLNPTTREEEKKPINEIASSHMARRTFVGNLYKKVKDPNLVGSLSGHKEGSRAFTRYRDIDEEIRKELIDLLD